MDNQEPKYILLMDDVRYRFDSLKDVTDFARGEFEPEAGTDLRSFKVAKIIGRVDVEFTTVKDPKGDYPLLISTFIPEKAEK